MEKQPDWRMGLSIVEWHFWNRLLLLCLRGMLDKAARPVCVEADKWSISVFICLQLGEHFF